MKTRRLFFILCIFLGITGVTTAQLPSYVPSAGIQAWWGFNGNGNDQSINTNHFTNYNMAFISDRFSTPNAAVSGNGSSQYMQCATPTFSYGANSSFTISFWMKKTTNSSGVMMMHGTTTAGNFIWNFQTNSTGGVMFGANKQQSAWIWTQTTHGLNTWEHYVATYNSGTITLYKNGVVAGSNIFTHTGVSQTVLPIWLGRGVSGSYSNASLDDIGMWNRVLTQSEITDLYTGGCAPSFSSVTVSSCNSYPWAQNNQTYTQSGDYYDTLMNYLGCDSIITLHLTILANTTATQNFLECDSFTWINGITYTSSVDTVTYIIPNAAGCDSIITLDLTILNLHFTQQPSNAQANTGTNAVFQAYGSQVGANHRWQTYQGGSWIFLMDTGQYTGSLTTTLTVSNITVQNHQQQFRCVSYMGACSDTSDVAQIVVPDIGIGEIPASAQFSLFPNPVKDEFTLAVDHDMMGSPYSLTDQSGRVVLSGIADADRISVHVGHLPAGIYLFSFDGMPASSVRVVKQ